MTKEEKRRYNQLMNIINEAAGVYTDENYMIMRAKVLALGHSCNDCKYYGISMNGDSGCANKESKYAGIIDDSSACVCTKYKHFLDNS
jgi:hypothetical protein